ncbi:MAG: WYL domain-containing protein [Lentimicrobiaceae bacterium]|nr:WYL domain-containing protein [Lentimicrobiaceae bacterium]
MSQRATTTRHHLIINKLRRYKQATYNEIADYLAQESELQHYDFNISKRTFQRDVLEIESIYGITIKYNFSEKFYYIDEEFEPLYSDRFFEAFDIYNALKVNERNKQHIYLEKRQTQGTEHLYGLLHAINNCLQISFSYQKFYTDHLDQRTVNPLAVKEFKYRWYLVARDIYDNRVKIYAIDRMANLEFSKNHFTEEARFDLNNILKHSFGITVLSDEKPQKVVLSFSPFQGKYIKTLPLHETQKILIDNEKEVRISLNIFITHDFKMEILSMGETVKILEPKGFVEDMKETYRAALEQYA